MYLILYRDKMVTEAATSMSTYSWPHKDTKIIFKYFRLTPSDVFLFCRAATNSPPSHCPHPILTITGGHKYFSQTFQKAVTPAPTNTPALAHRGGCHDGHQSYRMKIEVGQGV